LIGGLLVAALFAALVVPWFVDWNNFRSSFEAEAEKILGHPVRVNGTSNVKILPSPSLTFTDVTVGDPGDVPMAKVDQFDVTIELMPLLQGEIRVVSMKLLRPEINIHVDEVGRIDWLERGAASQVLDVDKVILESVEIEDGLLRYDDFRSGISQIIHGIRATVSARSLSGPWKVDDASYDDGGRRVPFSLATGRMLNDGTIRVTADIQPPQWPVDLSTDGKIGRDGVSGLYYDGSYNLRQIGTSSRASDAEAWRSEGTFALNGAGLVIDRAIWSSGPPDRPSSLAGSLTINFGETPSFVGSAEANQIDLDRTLGSGPSEPLRISAVAGRVIEWLNGLPAPAMDGRLTFDVPVIVVGGSIIQDFGLAASVSKEGWKISELQARMPGQARLSVSDGALRTGDQLGFEGKAELVVLQPATFAGWWRGKTGTDERSGRLLSAFDLSGYVAVKPGRISFDRLRARIGTAEITGQFHWGEAPSGHRSLGTDLKADRIDYAQLKALAELLAGRNFDDTAVLADDYKIRLAAAELVTEDFVARDVFVDAAYTGDVLTVIQLSIGDLGGARYRVTNGQIKDVTTANPSGVLAGKFEAESLDGLARLADRLAPDSAVAKWLSTAGPVLSPAVVEMKITAPPEVGRTGMRIALDGVAGDTTLSLRVDATMDPDSWRDHSIKADLDLYSPDSSALLQQLGVASGSVRDDPGGRLTVQGRGIPAAGIDTTIIADLAGLIANVSATVTMPANGPPSLSGGVDLSSDNIDPAIALSGLAIPGAAAGTPIRIDRARFKVSAEGLDLAWRGARIADRSVSGDLAWKNDPERGWRLQSKLVVDEVDLSWLMSLGLGFAPVPTGDPDTPWSPTPFSPPTFGSIAGGLSIEAEHFYITDEIDLTNAKLNVQLQPQRITIDASDGGLAGGRASASMAIHNVGGNARLTGGFDLKGAALEPFFWRRDGRPIASGTMDVSANFESTGRSPAGLVSSLTGGGAIGISEGVARYVNPGTARLVIRESDVGQEFTEESLRRLLEDVLDADSLDFGSTDAAFAIAAGAIRLKNMNLITETMTASGDAVLDLNTMTIDSDWTLSFDPGDAKVVGTVPKAGLLFTGPLAAPRRRVDVLQFDAYLNMRLEARMLEIIEQEDAARLEAGRLRRLIKKQKEDGVRREAARIKAEAAERRRQEAAWSALAALRDMHFRRGELAAAKRLADVDIAAARISREASAARAQAQELNRNAAAAHEEAVISASELDDAREGEASAAAALTDAGENLTQVLAEFTRAEPELAKAGARHGISETALRNARTTHAQASAAEAVADETAARARRQHDSARTALRERQDEALRMGTAAELAAGRHTAAQEKLAALTASLTAAEKALALAEGETETAATELEKATVADTGAREVAADAASALTRATVAADVANARTTAAETARTKAGAGLEIAEAALTSTRSDADKAAAVLELTLLLGEGMSDSGAATAEDRKLATDMETQARNLADQTVAKAEAAAQILVSTRGHLDTADAAVAKSVELASLRDDELRRSSETLALAQREAQLTSQRRQQARETLTVHGDVMDGAEAARASTKADAELARQSDQAARRLVNETRADLSRVLAEEQVAAGDERDAGKVADEADTIVLSAIAGAKRVATDMALAEADFATASQELALAEDTSGDLAEQLRSMQVADAAARERLEAATAARIAALASARMRDRETRAIEVAAKKAAAHSQSLEIDAQRARLLAQRVADGMNSFEESATFASELSDRAEVGENTAAENILVVESVVPDALAEMPVTEEETPVEFRDVEPPLPRLRPPRPLNIIPEVNP
jgi:uncharacterized protein involved in outer membrane biogenesis